MANLSQLRRARVAAKKAGIRVVYGKDEKLNFYSKSGRVVSIWYPWIGRFNHTEEKDLEEVIRAIESGEIV